MKMLITGCAGFIGSHLAEELAASGHGVVGLDCFSDYYSRALKESNAAQVRAKGVQVLELDLAGDPLDEVLDGVEVVYHCAAQPGISQTTPFEAYLRNNIIATQRLVQAARALPGLRCFVNVSTSSVYGAHATDPEDAAPRPTSYYGVTKLAAEQLALSYQRTKDLPVCSLRLFSVYGPRERPEKLYPKLIRCILEDKPFPLYEGSEHHLRSYTYVGDIVAGLVAALENLDRCIGEIFNIGCDTAITTGEGIRIIEELIGKSAEIDVQPKRSGDQLRTHANIDKARRILGYDPPTMAREGLAREVVWYRDRIFGKVDVDA